MRRRIRTMLAIPFSGSGIGFIGGSTGAGVDVIDLAGGVADFAGAGMTGLGIVALSARDCNLASSALRSSASSRFSCSRSMPRIRITRAARAPKI